jgi:hypothetical protein
MNKRTLIKQIIARLMGKPEIYFRSAVNQFPVKWDLQ